MKALHRPVSVARLLGMALCAGATGLNLIEAYRWRSDPFLAWPHAWIALIAFVGAWAIARAAK